MTLAEIGKQLGPHGLNQIASAGNQRPIVARYSKLMPAFVFTDTGL
jgi:hypothetical protein